MIEIIQALKEDRNVEEISKLLRQAPPEEIEVALLWIHSYSYHYRSDRNGYLTELMGPNWENEADHCTRERRINPYEHRSILEWTIIQGTTNLEYNRIAIELIRAREVLAIRDFCLGIGGGYRVDDQQMSFLLRVALRTAVDSNNIPVAQELLRIPECEVEYQHLDRACDLARRRGGEDLEMLQLLLQQTSLINNEELLRTLSEEAFLDGCDTICLELKKAGAPLPKNPLVRAMQENRDIEERKIIAQISRMSREERNQALQLLAADR